MIRSEVKRTWLPVALGLALLCTTAGCVVTEVYDPVTSSWVPASALPKAPPQALTEIQSLTAPATVATRVEKAPAAVKASATAGDNLERLAALHAERSSETADQEYVLGRGDVLAIRAFDFDELNRRVRVDDDGTITLPLLGTVSVEGQPISEVQRDLTTRLGEYMYDPHIAVFVEEYRSQQIAVIGAVKRPGLVTLMNRRSKVLDAISAAGGMTDEASGQIYLIPSEGRANLEGTLEVLANEQVLMDGNGQVASNGKLFNDVVPIMLDTNQVPQGVESFFFSLPVRAGDVLVIPTSGHFIVEGWVGRAGTYPLRPGLTLRGALATSGGLAFAAKKSNIRIYRLSAGGGTDMHEVNYRDIVEREAEDVFIREGDVIEVSSSAVKLVPYGFYKLVVDLVRVGAKLPIIP